MRLRLVSWSFVAAALLLAAPLRAADPLDDAKSRFALLDGARVHYKSLGEGKEAVVFVHGWGGNMNVWRYQVPDLVGKTRIVLIDLPGHGQSDKPQIAYTMDHMAHAVAAVMKDAGVERAVLVGHSMGTPVVRQLYRQQPALVKALVFVDGALRPFGPPEEFDTFVAPFRKPDYKDALDRAFTGMTASTPPARRDVIKATAMATPQHVLVSAMEGMGKPQLYIADPIAVPVLSVHAKSPFWTPSYEKFLKGMAPKADYQMLDGVSHFLMVDKPEVFNPILLGFLRTVGLVAPAPVSKTP